MSSKETLVPDRTLAERLFSEHVAFCAQFQYHPEAPLLPSELLEMIGMTDARRSEFAAGRACAYEALSRFNVQSVTIGKGEGGMPLWPDSFCGSIAHTDGMACAAVCPIGEVLGLGVDVERVRILEADLARAVCREEELRALCEIETRGGPPGALIAFVAKEATFKALYPRLRQFLEFHDVWLRFSDVDLHGDGYFELVELRAGAERVTAKLRGRWALYGELIFAGAEFLADKECEQCFRR